MSMGGMKTPMPQMGGGAAPISYLELVASKIQTTFTFNNYTLAVDFGSGVDFDIYKILEFYFFAKLRPDWDGDNGYLGTSINGITNPTYNYETFENRSGVANYASANGAIYANGVSTAFFSRGKSAIIKGQIFKNTHNKIQWWVEYAFDSMGFGIIQANETTASGLTEFKFHMQGGAPPQFDIGSSIYVYGRKIA